LIASRFAGLKIGCVVAVIALAGCVPPRVVALPGTVASVQQIPGSSGLDGHHLVVFQWEMHDGDIVARGDGAARIASPDSVRLDFFLGGGMGAGAVVVVGDSVRVPSTDLASRLIPSRALLWAALGKFDTPAERDTVVRVDGATLRVDIGAPTHWRATFRGDSLSRLERVDDGRLQEWVERSADQKVQYRNVATRRSLSLVIQRSNVVASFDPSIWSF
jgi:hypothetical protein